MPTSGSKEPDVGTFLYNMWHVNAQGRFWIWCDASSVAMAADLECDGEIVKDGAWLRKRKDPLHINFAELVVVMKGVTLAMRWKVKQLEIMTDSASAYWWLRSLATEEQRLRVSGDGEILIHRRLELIAVTLKEYEVEWTVSLVPSEKNRTDPIPRVPKDWLKADVAALATLESAPRAHAEAHGKVEPTLWVARAINQDVMRAEVKKVVSECVPCGEYDPHPVKEPKGSLQVDQVWSHLACDVTHVGNEKFVTIIDCGPSRFAVWQRVTHESETEVMESLRKVFDWYGVPRELLMDNIMVFRSKGVEELCRKWAVNRLFRAAYKARGNGVVECHHRTVKRMKARCGGTLSEAVKVYNLTPRGPLYAIPAQLMFWRAMLNPLVRKARVDADVLIRRRLELIAATLKEYEVEWTDSLVPSEKNRADLISRVPQDWLKADVAALATLELALRAHAEAHEGVEPTLCVARAINQDVMRAEVKKVVSECVTCSEYDPHPVKEPKGSLRVDQVWSRLACNVTHVGNEKFVTIIDCGPSRFAVWQRVTHESETEVMECLCKVFDWYGVPRELLMDNVMVFRSKGVEELCRKWEVNRLFRAAYKARGIGVMECHHRTMKRMKAKCEAVKVYNLTPRGPLYAIPAELMFRRDVQDVQLSRMVANESGSIWTVPAPVILLDDMMDGDLNPDERPSVSTRLETEGDTLLSKEELWRGLPFADKGGPRANEDLQRPERNGRESEGREDTTVRRGSQVCPPPPREIWRMGRGLTSGGIPSRGVLLTLLTCSGRCTYEYIYIFTS